MLSFFFGETRIPKDVLCATAIDYHNDDSVLRGLFFWDKNWDKNVGQECEKTRIFHHNIANYATTAFNTVIHAVWLRVQLFWDTKRSLKILNSYKKVDMYGGGDHLKNSEKKVKHWMILALSFVELCVILCC